MIRVVLPFQLRVLAHVEEEVSIEVDIPPRLNAVLDALEKRYPVLKGTIRDRATGNRRPFLRFYAGQMDLSNVSPDVLLPEAVASGKEPLHIIGAIAGG